MNAQTRRKKKSRKIPKASRFFKLQANIDSDNKANEDSLSEFCFMAMENGEEVEENDELQQAFEDLRHESITLANKNKEMKIMMEKMAKETNEQKKKVASMEKNLDQSIFINKELNFQLKEC